MQYRQQSAIEFISVYGLVLLIIAIVLALLIFIGSIPRTILPTQCAYYNTFTCPDAVLSTNATGSTLLVDSVDSTPGIVNISSFSAFIGSGNSRSGYCVPSQTQQGQTVYCIANFNFSLSTGTAYTGTFSIHANYCTGPPSTILSASCPAGSNYSFAGSIRIQPSHAIIGGINTSLSGGASGRYVPITITNNQPGAAPAHFQQMITLDPQTYAQFERADLGNLRFYYGSKEMYSWCESGCSSSSASAVFWVRMPVAIPSQGSRVIDMYFLPFSVQYDGIYAGEAPQLTTPYAEYDNGASVFNNYWNFAGTGLPSGLTSTSSTDTITVDDGLTVTEPTAGSGYAWILTGSIPAGQIIETDLLTSSSELNTRLGWSTSTSLGGQENPYSSYDNNIGGTAISGVWITSTSAGGIAVTPTVVTKQSGIFSFAWLGTGSQWYSYNYQKATSSDTTLSIATDLYGYFGVGNLAYSSGTTDSQSIYWLRTRAYPPNGVMPTAVVGG